MPTPILLRNARVPTLSMQIDALVDNRLLHLCIPQHVCDALRLEKVDDKEETLADGSTGIFPYVGPVEVHGKNGAAFTGALVMGDRVLLGRIPMLAMDPVVI